MIINNHLIEFRKAFPYVRCWVEDNYLVYSVPISYCDMVAVEANKLIDKMGLPLEARSNNTNSIMFNSVIVALK